MREPIQLPLHRKRLWLPFQKGERALLTKTSDTNYVHIIAVSVRGATSMTLLHPNSAQNDRCQEVMVLFTNLSCYSILRNLQFREGPIRMKKSQRERLCHYCLEHYKEELEYRSS